MADAEIWRDRFTKPRIRAIRVAPADRTAGAVTIMDGQGLRLHAWDVPGGVTRPAVAVPATNLYLAWWLGHDGRCAYVLGDQGGNEIGHLIAIDLRGDRPPVDLTPDLDPYTNRGVGLSLGGAGLVLSVIYEGDYRVYHLADPAAPAPAPRLLARYQQPATGCRLSADGTVATVDLTIPDSAGDRSTVQVLRVADGEPLRRYRDEDASHVNGHLFSPRPGDPTVVVTTNRTGVRRPVLWQVDDDDRRPLVVGDLPGDVLPLDWSGDGRQLLLCHSWRAGQQLFRYDLATDRLEPLAVPAGAYHDELIPAGGAQFGPDGSVLVAVESMAKPVTVYRHQPRPGGSTTTVLDSAAPVGMPARSVDFRSDDGTLVQGWFATPEGIGPFPTLIRVHGGPHHVERDAYDPRAQVWLDHGYAYLGLNYRGSTTFGTAYLEAIAGDPGQRELADLVAARQWLVDQGAADPDRVLIQGGSYGGYLTLLALGVRPELWAGGIAEIAIADWALTYADANPANRAFMALPGTFGGTPEQVPERYRKSSPLTYLAALRAPVLVRQARGDSRAPARQMEVYEREARRLGKPVTVLWGEGGHSPTGDPLDYWSQVLEFAAGCRRPAG